MRALIGYSNSEYLWLFTSELSARFSPENIVIIAQINELKWFFVCVCVLCYLTFLVYMSTKTVFYLHFCE